MAFRTMLFILLGLVCTVHAQSISINYIKVDDTEIEVKITASVPYTSTIHTIELIEKYYNKELRAIQSKTYNTSSEIVTYFIFNRYYNSRDLSYSEYYVNLNYGPANLAKMTNLNSPNELIYSTKSDSSYVTLFDYSTSVTSLQEAFPTVNSKKGLLANFANGDPLLTNTEEKKQMEGKHFEMCLNLGQLFNATTGEPIIIDGTTYYIDKTYLNDLDSKIQEHTNNGCVVYLSPQLHTDASPSDPLLYTLTSGINIITAYPNKMYAINTTNEAGIKKFQAAMEFIARRYSNTSDTQHRVHGYIIGNEVDFHGDWYNMGPKSQDIVIDQYYRTLRMAYAAVVKYFANARVYIPLTHCWNTQASDNNFSIKGKYFIDRLNDLSMGLGNFNWNVAYHPYSKLPDVYNEGSIDGVTYYENTDFITAKNMEVLRDYFNKSSLLYNNNRRSIIFSEQGYWGNPSDPNSLDLQSKSFIYTYSKVQNMNGIDAFIYYLLNDVVDDGKPVLYGLRDLSGNNKPIYNLFRDADSPKGLPIRSEPKHNSLLLLVPEIIN